MKTKLLILLIFGAQLVFSQNQLGLHSSNYSGVSGFGYNPAIFQAGPLPWDVSILSGGAFVENQYAYIENTHALELFTTNKPLVQRIPTDIPLNDASRIYYNFNDATTAMNNTVNGFVGLPAVAIRVNRNLSLGLFSKMRVAFSANNLDQDLDYYSIDYWQEGDIKQFEQISAKGMVWNETGINIGFNGPKSFQRKMVFGVSIKYLSGLQSLYVRAPDRTGVLLVPDQIYARSGMINYGFSYNPDNLIEILGNGIALDLGLIYLERADDERLYKWKLGLAINDLGRIKMKVNSEAHQINANNAIDIQLSSFNQISDLKDFTQVLSNEASGSPTASLKSREYAMFTPAALNISFDYSINPQLYLNANANRRLVVNPQEIERENYLALSARYETKFFEIGVPMVLFDDRNLRTGIWFRIMFLTIGSDHVGSLFVDQQQFTGSDFYFAIKLNELSFRKAYNKERKRSPENCYF